MVTPAAERVGQALTMVPDAFRVLRKRPETADTWTLELEPAAGGGGPAFAPGQFSMLYSFGAGEVPISVSGDLTRPGPLVHTVRAVGAVTSALCRAEPGAVLGVRGPFGTCWPLEAAEGRDLVILAGGLGLAPLRPVICHVLAHRERYANVALLYGGRSPDELLYSDEMDGWLDRPELLTRVTVDAAPAGWHGRVGLVTKPISEIEFDLDGASAMICGPEVMMRFAVAALVERGMAEDSIHVSLERNMKCAVGHCGHCQLGPVFVCRDGPVFSWDAVGSLVNVREL